VRESCKWLDQLGDTEGLRYLVVEDEGIPERILFKISGLGRERQTATEAYSDVLQTIIDEFRIISPETKNALIFKSNGQTIAGTKDTTEDQIKKIIANFDNIAQQAETIGGIENLTIQAADSQLAITAINSLYLATVSSRAANPEIVKSLTHVLVPTVVRLVDQVASLPSENQPFQAVQVEEKQAEEKPIEETLQPVQLVEEKPQVESEPIAEPQPQFEPLPPKTPINQFMVEKLTGMLVPVDTVRIDGEIIAKWTELYDGKEIKMVNIEALDGKKTTCKVKAIKESKSNAKGVIQIPERILQTLQIEKGKLVMVKPVVE
jgi:hypothetical protein